VGPVEEEGGEQDVLRGPHGWVNWRAEQLGQPRREAKHPDNFVVRPIWQEFMVYTDAAVGGAWLQLGPFEAIPLNPERPPRLGFSARALLLRVWDHLEDALPGEAGEPETDVADYTGGDIGDEFAALLGLALGRRLRSGGMVRQGLPGGAMPLGYPSESDHREPYLEPPHREPLIAWLAEPVDLGEATELLADYPAASASDAVALVRAARQYVDGLWLADADPRLAWIKLIGALEAAAVAFDNAAHTSAVEQLKAHRPSLYRKLEGSPEALRIVAEETSRLFRVQAKLRGFLAEFAPGPPEVRPEQGLRVDWGALDALINKVYEHRSADLHEGVAFPPPLCEPPMVKDDDGIPAERMPFLGISMLGAEWQAEDLPMYLHVFAYLVGESLRNWWRSLAAS
jgi:hypothetical protein